MKKMESPRIISGSISGYMSEKSDEPQDICKYEERVKRQWEKEPEEFQRPSTCLYGGLGKILIHRNPTGEIIRHGGCERNLNLNSNEFTYHKPYKHGAHDQNFNWNSDFKH
jgi:hypothetical protein